MSHLLLSHLSKNNNDPRLVKELFDNCAGDTNIIVASRFEETAVYHVRSKGEEKDNAQRQYQEKSYQATLF